VALTPDPPGQLANVELVIFALKAVDSSNVITLEVVLGQVKVGVAEKVVVTSDPGEPLPPPQAEPLAKQIAPVPDTAVESAVDTPVPKLEILRVWVPMTLASCAAEGEPLFC